MSLDTYLCLLQVLMYFSQLLTGHRQGRLQPWQPILGKDRFAALENNPWEVHYKRGYTHLSKQVTFGTGMTLIIAGTNPKPCIMTKFTSTTEDILCEARDLLSNEVFINNRSYVEVDQPLRTTSWGKLE